MNSSFPKVSIIVRCYNEEKHLPKLFFGLQEQDYTNHEVIFVDSGSTDSSVAIAESFGAKIVNIPKSLFSFGRALNLGCSAADGDILVFVSAHVFPFNSDWLSRLIEPFEHDNIGCTYGAQRGGETNKFSEHCLFEKWFPAESEFIHEGYFCNNACCAVRRDLWEQFPYDEELTGLEDIDWAKRVRRATGTNISYVAEAAIVHVHEESWAQVRNRYRREAIAMKSINPEVRLSAWDIIRLIPRHVFNDCKRAFALGRLSSVFGEISLFRFNQFWGSYRGFVSSDALSRDLRERMYFPDKSGPVLTKPVSPKANIRYENIFSQSHPSNQD